MTTVYGQVGTHTSSCILYLLYTGEDSCAVLEDFSANLLNIGVIDNVTTLILKANKMLKQESESIERGIIVICLQKNQILIMPFVLLDVETFHSSFLEKKVLLEILYEKAEVELNDLLQQEKSFSQTLNQYSVLERQATSHCVDLLTMFYVHVLSESQKPHLI